VLPPGKNIRSAKPGWHGVQRVSHGTRVSAD